MEKAEALSKALSPNLSSKEVKIKDLAALKPFIRVGWHVFVATKNSGVLRDNEKFEDANKRMQYGWDMMLQFTKTEGSKPKRR